jgi:endonuclease/exonuclease/phosphatase family metal-dependent hydrolase
MAALAVAVGLSLPACSSGSGSTGTGSGSGATAGSGTGRPASVRVLTQNLLHGTACAPDSDRCNLPGRVALFARQLDAAGCPDLVSLQETNEETVTQLRAALPAVCGDRYDIVWDDDPASDREVVVTTLPVLGQERVRLAGPLRTALWVRVRAPVGAVDFVSTHLASSSDDRPCDRSTCPAPCERTDSLNQCQARQAADLLDERAGRRSVGIFAGDLNAQPDEPTIAVLRHRGYVDAAVATGTASCTSADRTGCTSGRVDDSLVDLTNPASRQQERIDYVFLASRRDCTLGPPAGVLRPEGGPTGADGIVFPADHSGVQVEVTCVTTTADRAAARPLAASSTTTTTGAAVPATTRAAVQRAFDTVFSDVEPDPSARLDALEDGDALRASFLARLRSLGPLDTEARIDSFTTAGPGAVDVVYSVLLNGSVVLDALPGRAVRDGPRWLVSKATYCQVASLGTDTVPEPCR